VVGYNKYILFPLFLFIEEWGNSWHEHDGYNTMSIILNKELLKPTKEKMLLYIHVISIFVSIVNIIVRKSINTHADNI